MRKFVTLLASLAVLLVGIFPAFAQEETGTIVDVAAGNEDFSTLVAAVQAAGLVDALSDPDASYTVFAPTNAAFEAALADLGLTAEELLADTETLTSILTYHVIDGAVMAESVMGMDGQSATTLNGADIAISVTDSGVVLNDSVNVIQTDIEASNGVIHVIDGVLLPPMDDMMAEEEMMEEPLTHVRIHHFSPDAPAVDLYVNGEIIVDSLAFPTSSQWLNIPAGSYEIAVAPADTSIDEAVIGPTTLELDAGVWYNVAAIGSVASETLAPAIFVEQLGTPLGDETTARVTVFHAIEGAPAVDVLADGEPLITNLAFPDELDGNDGAFTVDVPAGTYELSVFTVDGETQVLDLGEVMLEAGTTYLVAAVGTPDSPQAATVAVTDAQMAENMGMDMEEDMSEDDMMGNTIADIVVASAEGESPEFTTLLAAVQAAGLVETLSDPDASYTVFAPTDAAFAAALDSLGLTADELLADTETLTSILTYHVIDGAVMAESVMGMDGQSATTLNGADIAISVTDSGVVLNDSVNVVQTDVEASNGVIHVIDGVLLPPSE